jgi:mevalonate pyrophosphate decarboxylase
MYCLCINVYYSHPVSTQLQLKISSSQIPNQLSDFPDTWYESDATLSHFQLYFRIFDDMQVSKLTVNNSCNLKKTYLDSYNYLCLTSTSLRCIEGYGINTHVTLYYLCAPAASICYV